MARKQTADDRMLKALRKFGLNYPGAHLKSPWPGHGDLAVNDKTFCYLNVAGQPFAISCKLPQSCDTALMLSFTKPTGYGLGKSGWVSASFPDGKLPPIELLQEWIDESYRAQAPKRLIKQLSAPATAAAKNKPAKNKPAKNKPAKKRARS